MLSFNFKIKGVSQDTVKNKLRDVIEKEKEAEAQEILELYLNCYSQEEIAEKKDIAVGTVKNKLRETVYNFIKSYKIINLISNLQFYNAWQTFGLNEKQLKFPGQLPYDLVENIFHSIIKHILRTHSTTIYSAMNHKFSCGFTCWCISYIAPEIHASSIIWTYS